MSEVGSFGWNEIWDQKISDLWKAGWSATEVVGALRKNGVYKTRNAVIGRLHRMGLTNATRTVQSTHPKNTLSRSQVTFTPEMDEQLRQLAGEGVSKSNAARRMAISPSRLSDRVAALSLEWKAPANRSQIERTVSRKDIVTADFDAKALFTAPAKDDAIPLVGRPFGTCGWPVGVPDRPGNQLCCGGKVEREGSSYCGHHAAISRSGDTTAASRQRAAEKLAGWVAFTERPRRRAAA